MVRLWSRNQLLFCELEPDVCCRRGQGTMLWRKTLGIVGLGNIGRAVALRAAHGFSMCVVAATPHHDIIETEAFAAAHGIELRPLAEVLGVADIVSLHGRLSPETEGLIGATELAMMKPSSMLINTARQVPRAHTL